LVAEAVGRGVNYFDVAPSYGNAEERLGPALKPYRKDVFLACKTEERSKSAAEKQLGESLARLHTDHVDLYQLHGISTMDEARAVLAPGGALEALVKAKEKGLARFIGFSAHHEEAACMLLGAFDFDTVMFPINYVMWLKAGVGPKVIEAAARRGAGVLALKALGRRKRAPGEARAWPKCWYQPVETPEEAALALRFTLSKPVTAAVSPSHVEFLRWMCDTVDRGLLPLTAAEEADLRSRAATLEPVLSGA
jgi:aryl-alcohol dehydrogenase-like predicted oxidoreductase